MFLLLVRITSKTPTHVKCRFGFFACESASECSDWWEFGLGYIDSCQDAKPIIILSKTLVKLLVKC